MHLFKYMYTCIYICAQRQENLFDPWQHSFFLFLDRGACPVSVTVQSACVCVSQCFISIYIYINICIQRVHVCDMTHSYVTALYLNFGEHAHYLWPLSCRVIVCVCVLMYVCVTELHFHFFPFFPADAQYLFFFVESVCVCVSRCFLGHSIHGWSGEG